MRKLPHTAAEDLLELIMRRYERASTMLTSNRPVDDWGKLLGDTAAVTALLDRLLHHAHVLKRDPRSWRTKVHTDWRTEEPAKWNSTGLGHRRGNGRFCPSTKWAAGACRTTSPSFACSQPVGTVCAWEQRRRVFVDTMRLHVAHPGGAQWETDCVRRTRTRISAS